MSDTKTDCATTIRGDVVEESGERHFTIEINSKGNGWRIDQIIKADEPSDTEIASCLKMLARMITD